MNFKDIRRSLPLSITALLLVVGVLYATTTIGTNISTDGTLTVGSTSQFSGNVTLVGANLLLPSGYGIDSSVNDGVLNIGTSTAQQINLGTSSSIDVINIGNSAGVLDLNISAGASIDVNGPMSMTKNYNTVTSVTFSTSPTFNAALGNVFTMSLSGNITSTTISNASVGQVLTFIFTQSGTNRTIAFDDLRAAGGALTLSTSDADVDTVTCVMTSTTVCTEISWALDVAADS